ncbi:hypothetical protein GQ53DRAFT_386206 [Thozetella sp. PMI_491]|nr:hypothetical protein GQ53DRAFT_386206 [Thozetella sp. PMI_491]
MARGAGLVVELCNEGIHLLRPDSDVPHGSLFGLGHVVRVHRVTLFSGEHAPRYTETKRRRQLGILVRGEGGAATTHTTTHRNAGVNRVDGSPGANAPLSIWGRQAYSKPSAEGPVAKKGPGSLDTGYIPAARKGCRPSFFVRPSCTALSIRWLDHMLSGIPTPSSVHVAADRARGRICRFFILLFVLQSSQQGGGAGEMARG